MCTIYKIMHACMADHAGDIPANSLCELKAVCLSNPGSPTATPMPAIVKQP